MTKREANMRNAAFSAPDIDEDYVLWMEGQIAILRNRQFSQLDIALLLEELDFFVGKHKRELRGRLRLQMLHLLQCEYQPLLRSTREALINSSETGSGRRQELRQ
jgi:hypothetical protein